LSGGGLQDRSHGNVDGLANHFARVINDDHSAVIEIGDALVVLFSFFKNKYAHDFAREDDGLERVGQFVDVQHGHTLELGDFIEVEVVGDDLAFVKLGQFDELHIDFADAGEIVFHDLDLDRSRFLQTLQDIEATASAIAFERVGGIGHQLQFAEHELRDYDQAVEKAGLGDVGDAAVNNDAGVENLVTFFARPFAAEGGANQALQAHRTQPPLEHNDGATDQQTDSGGKVPGQVKRTNDKADNTDDKDKQKAYK